MNNLDFYMKTLPTYGFYIVFLLSALCLLNSIYLSEEKDKLLRYKKFDRRE